MSNSEESRILLSISDIWRRFDQVYSRWAENHGFSTNAMSLLEELHNKPEGIEPAAVADYLGVPRQTMTSTLDTLEARGIIERHSHPTDRRRKLIRLTAKGLTETDALIKELYSWEMAALSTLPERERRRTFSAVSRFCKSLESTVSSNTGEK